MFPFFALAQCATSSLSQTPIVNPPSILELGKGSWNFSASSFYARPQQEGLEYALLNSVYVYVFAPTTEEIQEVNHLIDADILTPPCPWNFGYRLSLGHLFAFDGWQLDLTWSHFSSTSFNMLLLGVEELKSILPLWSAFNPAQGLANNSKRIDCLWELLLDVIDLDLGRIGWVSKYVSARPFIGIRYPFIKQELQLEPSGGSWSPRIRPLQDGYVGKENFKNFYKGVGIRGGLSTFWRLVGGFGLYGNVAGSIVYGVFEISQREDNKFYSSPSTKSKILSSYSRFHASRPIFDLDGGIEWAILLCDGLYGCKIKLFYEMHIFFDQNQLWRTIRVGDEPGLYNGQNVFNQARGSLDIQGFGIKLDFTF